jgi:hypothetical protein
MIGAGSASQLLSNARPVSAGGMPPVSAIRGVSHEGGEPESGRGGFGPAVVVSLRGGESPSGELPPEEQEMVKELQARDREVRTHEMAHLAAGGQYASGPTYTYQTGPDGKRYAIGGEVQIDTSPEKTPEETIRKMELVKRAALAPAEPSAQDVRVAQLAEQQRSEAQAELSRRRADEMTVRMEGDSGRFASATAAYGDAAKLVAGPAAAGGGSIGLF